MSRGNKVKRSPSDAAARAPAQLPLPFDGRPARKPDLAARNASLAHDFDAWCDREAQREVCEPFLQLHAAGMTFVAIVVARALAREVA